MRVFALTLGILLLGSTTTFGQTAKPGQSFAWDTADTPARAQSHRWELELDGVVAPTPLRATCVPGTGSDASCSALIPAVTPAQHSVRLRAVDAADSTLVSDWSAPLTFTMRAVPATPTGLTIR